MKFEIIFSDHLPMKDVALFVDSNFGGFGIVSTTEDPRRIILVGVSWPYTPDVVKAQLDMLRQHGSLQWRTIEE
jgi:hypothetical protein